MQRSQVLGVCMSPDAMLGMLPMRRLAMLLYQPTHA